jgi:hypothetical protein
VVKVFHVERTGGDLAERERQLAKIREDQRLPVWQRPSIAAVIFLLSELDRVMAERDEARAQVAMLREALKRIEADIPSEPEGWEIARDALSATEPKP